MIIDPTKLKERAQQAKLRAIIVESQEVTTQPNIRITEGICNGG